MSADLHVVGDEYAEALVDARQCWAAIGAKLMQCEKPGATNYEMARKAEMLALDLSQTFGRLANIAWERDDID